MKLHRLMAPSDPAERGRAIGTAHAECVRATSARYLRHFELLGIPASQVREIADHSRAALERWSPALAIESDAIAQATGLTAMTLTATQTTEDVHELPRVARSRRSAWVGGVIVVCILVHLIVGAALTPGFHWNVVGEYLFDPRE